MLRRPRPDRLDRPSRAAPAALPDDRLRRGHPQAPRGGARRPRRRRGRGRVADGTPSAVPDVLAPGLDVVFCGINPGRVSAAADAHFANPRNDFWRLLHAARLHAAALRAVGAVRAARRRASASRTRRTARRPARATCAAATSTGSAERLERIARELRPARLAFVGKEAYRGAFSERPELGLQERTLGETQLFVLPSTSPANAAVPWAERLRWFRELPGARRGLPLRAGRPRASSSTTTTAIAARPLRRRVRAAGGSRRAAASTRASRDEQALRARAREECRPRRRSSSGPLLWTRQRFALGEPGHWRPARARLPRARRTRSTARRSSTSRRGLARGALVDARRARRACRRGRSGLGELCATARGRPARLSRSTRGV